MSSETLHAMAQSDTPDDVEVPKGWAGIIVWALGKFGAAMVLSVAFAAVVAFALLNVYNDSKQQSSDALKRQIEMTDRVLSAFQDNVRVQEKTVAMLESIKTEIHDSNIRSLQSR